MTKEDLNKLKENVASGRKASAKKPKPKTKKPTAKKPRRKRMKSLPQKQPERGEIWDYMGVKVPYPTELKIEVMIPLKPKPVQSARIGSTKEGKKRMFQDQKVESFKKSLAIMTKDYLHSVGFEMPPENVPIVVELFHITKIASVKIPELQVTLPDVDNLGKGVLDGMRTAGCYQDDGQVSIYFAAKIKHPTKQGILIRLKIMDMTKFVWDD